MALYCSKKSPELLRGITSKHHSGFSFLDCLLSFQTKKKLEPDKKICKNKDFYNVIMPSEDNKMLKFNQYQISDKAPFIIYTDLESLIEKLLYAKIIVKNRLQQM